MLYLQHGPMILNSIMIKCIIISGNFHPLYRFILPFRLESSRVRRNQFFKNLRVFKPTTNSSTLKAFQNTNHKQLRSKLIRNILHISPRIYAFLVYTKLPLLRNRSCIWSVRYIQYFISVTHDAILFFKDMECRYLVSSAV